MIIGLAWGALILIFGAIWIASCIYSPPFGSRKKQRISTILWAPAFNGPPSSESEDEKSTGRNARDAPKCDIWMHDLPSTSDVSSQATIKKPAKSIERKYAVGILDKDVPYKVVKTTALSSPYMNDIIGRNAMDEQHHLPVKPTQNTNHYDCYGPSRMLPAPSVISEATYLPPSSNRYNINNNDRPASVQTAQESRAALNRHASIFSQVQLYDPARDSTSMTKPWTAPPQSQQPRDAIKDWNRTVFRDDVVPSRHVVTSQTHHHYQPTHLPPSKPNPTPSKRTSYASTVANVVTLYAQPPLPSPPLTRISEEGPTSPSLSSSSSGSTSTTTTPPSGESKNGHQGTQIANMRRLMMEQQQNGNETYACYDYVPLLGDEVSIRVGDRVLVEQVFADGWGYGWNVRSRARGMFPMGCLEELNLNPKYNSSLMNRGQSMSAPRRTSSLVRRVVPGG
ncbi:hypothetical protein HDV00_006206 [Rhizophlyctis rosea]|nr:hypothetical protein HDV00_006206 [Rhizophlyctis rosea]